VRKRSSVSAPRDSPASSRSRSWRCVLLHPCVRRLSPREHGSPATGTVATRAHPTRRAGAASGLFTAPVHHAMTPRALRATPLEPGTGTRGARRAHLDGADNRLDERRHGCPRRGARALPWRAGAAPQELPTRGSPDALPSGRTDRNAQGRATRARRRVRAPAVPRSRPSTSHRPAPPPACSPAALPARRRCALESLCRF